MLLLTVASESGFREHRQPRLEAPADSTEPDFERLDPTFRAVISSVKLEAPFPYRERSLFARAMASITVPALFGSGCTIGGLWVFRRRRKTERIALAGERVSSSGATWKIALGLLLAFGHVSTLLCMRSVGTAGCKRRPRHRVTGLHGDYSSVWVYF